MIRWYVTVKNLLKELESKSKDALELFLGGDQDQAVRINGYMKADYKRLEDIWHQIFPKESLGYLGRHIKFGLDNDYIDIIERDLPDLEKRAENHLLNSTETQNQELIGFEQLLHPVIAESSYQLYRDSHLREAVLNSIVAVFDFIRANTGVGEDGDRLISQVMSLSDPKLILSELDTDSGQNDQKGFMQIFKGAYQGIRNPKAHSLTHDLTPLKAAQYLVFASLLARRIEEATIIEKT